MVRNGKVGERVKLSDKCTFSKSTESNANDVVICFWDTDLGTTGTIVEVIKHRRTYLYVEPDPPNFGRMFIRPSHLDRLEE